MPLTALLRHYYTIITSLFPIAKTGNNELIITYYALSLFSLFHYYDPLLPLLPIITCTQLGNLQMRLTHRSTKSELKLAMYSDSLGHSVKGIFPIVRGFMTSKYFLFFLA